MKSQVIKRSVVIDGHKTSISLEDPFWSSLKAIAQGATVAQTVTTIHETRKQGNLSSAVRLFVLDCVRNGQMGMQVQAQRADSAGLSAIAGNVRYRVPAEQGTVARWVRDVRFWQKADIGLRGVNVCFGGKAGGGLGTPTVALSWPVVRLHCWILARAD